MHYTKPSLKTIIQELMPIYISKIDQRCVIPTQHQMVSQDIGGNFITHKENLAELKLRIYRTENRTRGNSNCLH